MRSEEVEDVAYGPGVKQICEKYLVNGEDVYFAFTDLEEAFHSVEEDAMWKILK